MNLSMENDLVSRYSAMLVAALGDKYSQAKNKSLRRFIVLEGFDKPIEHINFKAHGAEKAEFT